jgi:hypothetical protein
MRGRNRQANPQTRRIPIAAPITLEVGEGQELAGQISNLSQGGFFVVSSSPGRTGLTGRFQLEAVPDWKPITGQARVVWARGSAAAPDRPPGMGMTITDIATEDRRRLRAVVFHYVRTGALPEGAEPEPTPLEPPTLDPQERMPAAPADDVAFPDFISASRPTILPRATSRRLRHARLVAAAATLLLAALAGAWWSRVSSSPPAEPAPADPGLPRAEVSVAATSRPAPAPAPAADSPAATPPADPSSLEPELREAVATWSRAWESQQLDAYLDSYSARFRPEGSTSRSSWERQRRRRLTSPEFIELTITELRIEATGVDRARATFHQAYRSDHYADEVEKVLVWVREGSRWRILTERSNDESAP